MNFFAHALHCLDDPYRLAGVATPDWLTVVRPRVRCRTKHALPWTDADQLELRALAEGIVRHHRDDAWFHQTPAFTQLSLQFARQIRETTGDTDGMRPSFVGHILVELLLDAQLMADYPEEIDRYYRAVDQLDAPLVAYNVSRMINARAEDLIRVIGRFASERFLYDYATDEGLCYRLNQVMHRVGLPPLPAKFERVLPEAREAIALQTTALFPPDEATA